MISDVFRIVSILCVVYFLSKGLMILLFLSLPILFLLTRTFQRRMLSAQLDNRKAVAGINQAIPETIASIRTIRLYTANPSWKKGTENPSARGSTR